MYTVVTLDTSQVVTNFNPIDEADGRRLNRKPRTRRRDAWLAYYYRQEPLLGWARSVRQNSRRRARLTGVRHDLTLEQIMDMLPQDMLCPILGIELRLGHGKGPAAGHQRSHHATIDRKYPRGPYTAENCHVISDRANRSKAALTLLQMVAMGNWAEKYLKDNPLMGAE